MILNEDITLIDENEDIDEMLDMEELLSEAYFDDAKIIKSASDIDTQSKAGAKYFNKAKNTYSKMISRDGVRAYKGSDKSLLDKALKSNEFKKVLGAGAAGAVIGGVAGAGIGVGTNKVLDKVGLEQDKKEKAKNIAGNAAAMAVGGAAGGLVGGKTSVKKFNYSVFTVGGMTAVSCYFNTPSGGYDKSGKKKTSKNPFGSNQIYLVAVNENKGKVILKKVKLISKANTAGERVENNGVK